MNNLQTYTDTIALRCQRLAIHPGFPFRVIFFDLAKMGEYEEKYRWEVKNGTVEMMQKYFEMISFYRDDIQSTLDTFANKVFLEENNNGI